MHDSKVQLWTEAALPVKDIATKQTELLKNLYSILPGISSKGLASKLEIVNGGDMVYHRFVKENDFNLSGKKY